MRIVTLALVAALFIAPRCIRAQVVEWSHVAGPEGRDVSVLFAAGDGQFVEGTRSGAVYVSSTDGVTWTRAIAGTVGSRINTIVEEAPGALLMGTHGAGIHRSTDGGHTWDPLGPIVDNPYIRSVARDAAGRIWAGGDSNATPSSTVNRGGIFRSTDDGATWTRLAFPATESRINEILPLGNGVVVALGTRGIQRSTDDGATWTASSTGMPPTHTPYDGVVRGDGSILVTADAGMYVSSNDGVSWSRFPGSLGTTLKQFITRSRDGFILVANRFSSIHISQDDGVTWNYDIGQARSDRVMDAIAGSPSALLAGFNGLGIMRTGGGSPWALVSDASFGAITSSIAFPSASIAVAAYGRHVLRSTDAGATWAVVDGIVGRARLRIGTMPNGDLVAIDRDSTWRSTDAGATWAPTTVEYGDGSSPDVEIFGPSAGSAAFLIRSGIVHRSTDDGATWQPVRDGLSDGDASDLAATPDGALFALMGDGPYRSTDLGETWSRRAAGLDGLVMDRLAADARGGLFVTAGRQLYASFDDGASWAPVANQFDGSDVTGLAVDRTGRAIVATRDAGVSVLDSGATTWQRTNDGLASSDADFLTLSPRGDIYVGTKSGLWRAGAVATPGADVAVAGFDFGRTQVANQCSRVVVAEPFTDIEVMNFGGDDAVISTVAIVGPDSLAFELERSDPATTITSGAVLASGASMRQRVRFVATEERTYDARIEVTLDNGATYSNVLRGAGAEAHIALTNIDLGTLVLEDDDSASGRVVVVSAGTRPWRLDAITVIDATGEFALRDVPALPTTVAPGDTLAFDVVFTPRGPGARRVYLDFEGDHSRCEDSIAVVDALATAATSVDDESDAGLSITSVHDVDGLAIDVRSRGVARIELVTVDGRTIAVREIEGSGRVVLADRVPAGTYLVRATSGMQAVSRIVHVVE